MSVATPDGAKRGGASTEAEPDHWDHVPKLSRRVAALALLGILLGILMGALDNLVVLTALPQIAIDLNQVNGVAFVVSAYLIAGTVSTPIFGKLSDHFSRRNFFILGQAIFIVGSLLAGQSTSLNELIVFRAVQGFGSGAFFPIGLSIIAVLFDPQTRAKLTGAMSSVFGVAMVVGPLVGAYIVDQNTILGSAAWRWVFYVNLPIGFLSVAVVLSSLGALRPTHQKRFDTLGALLLAGWVTPFMFALVQTSDSGWAWTDPRILGLIAAFVVVFIAFVLWELRVAEPVVPLRFFAKRVVAGSSGVTFLRGVAFVAVSTFVSILVAFVYGGSSDEVRDVLYFFVLPMIVGATLGGQLLRRLPYRVLSVAGMSIMSLGLFLLTRVTASTPVWDLVGAFRLGILAVNPWFPVGGLVLDLVPIGLGVGLTFAVTALSVQFAVPPKDIGAATSLITFLQNLGGAIGVSVLFSFAQYRVGALDPVPVGLSCPVPPVRPLPLACLPYYGGLRAATLTAYTDTFTVAFVIGLVALFCAFFMVGRLPTRQAPASGSPPAAA